MSKWLVTYTHPVFQGSPRETIVEAPTLEEATESFKKASNDLGFESTVTEYRNLDENPEPKLRKGKDHV